MAIFVPWMKLRNQTNFVEDFINFPRTDRNYKISLKAVVAAHKK